MYMLKAIRMFFWDKRGFVRQTDIGNQKGFPKPERNRPFLRQTKGVKCPESLQRTNITARCYKVTICLHMYRRC